MRNSGVQELLDECKNDLARVQSAVMSLGHQSTIVPYLNNYAIIKACGTVEIAFKTLISDHCSYRVKKQVKNYLSKNVKNSSSNPSYENICKLLKDFDQEWNRDFKDKIRVHQDGARLKTSMESLVSARNELAHGGNPSASVDSVILYFSDFYEVVVILDTVLS